MNAQESWAPGELEFRVIISPEVPDWASGLNDDYRAGKW